MCHGIYQIVTHEEVYITRGRAECDINFRVCNNLVYPMTHSAIFVLPYRSNLIIQIFRIKMTDLYFLQTFTCLQEIYTKTHLREIYIAAYASYKLSARIKAIEAHLDTLCSVGELEKRITHGKWISHGNVARSTVQSERGIHNWGMVKLNIWKY